MQTGMVVHHGMQDHERRTVLLSVYGVFTYPFACVPYLFFYFRDHDIGIAGYLQMIAWYYWAMVLTEVPTGLLADRYGRRAALASGSATLAAGFLILHQGSTFGVFCLGQAVLGIGHALLSGAPTAMLFDSLKGAGQAGRFLHTESRIHSLRLFGTGGAFLLGGALACLAGLRSTILLTALLCLVGSAVALMIREPASGTEHRPAILRTALANLCSRQLLWILVYFMFLFGLLRFAFHTYQPFFAETVFDQEHPASNWLLLGLLFAALNLFAAPSSRLVPWLTRRFSYRTLFLALPLSLSLAFLAMSQLSGWLAVSLFFAHQVPFGVHWALIQDYVNHRLAAHSRATTLSILSFAGRISFAAWLPLIGAYQDDHGTAAAYGWIGLIGLGISLLWCGPGSRLLRDQ